MQTILNIITYYSHLNTTNSIIYPSFIPNTPQIPLTIITPSTHLNIQTVPIYPKPDQNTLHLSLPHQPISIPQPNPLHTYLNIHPIISPPKLTQSNLIHPAYG
ncbi:biotin carboxylase N-terminal domain-containing protein, partial [Staphylococcus epidermidis]|uniref:biotin carboxylase N-terminal domain-containing protein n=1 Tax=Staphylococcus epidermidis TaxID=1282 RepID=UPI0028CB7E10